jgi:type II secretory pathway pseudopilin PulG
MDDNTFGNTNMAMGSSMPQPKKSKAGKVILMVVLAIVLLAAAAAGGWYVGNMQKDKAVEDAKNTAKQEALAEVNANKNSDASKEKNQAKTATETTCNADELSLAVDPSADGGAGTLTYHLTLKNTGKRTCILGGFPGVSLVNDNGNMVGSPAERATNYEEKKLTLAPNTEVMAMVSVANSDNFSDGQCKEGATKFRVYPPNDTGYLSAPSGSVDSWCPGFMTSPVMTM